MSKFADLKAHISNKQLNKNIIDKTDTELSVLDFFKRKNNINEKNISVKNNTKPIVKKVVLPETEKDIYLNVSGIKTNKLYVNPNLESIITTMMKQNVLKRENLEEIYNNEVIIKNGLNKTNTNNNYNNEIVIEM